jgi:thymidylate synthase (FAD)
MVKVTLEMHTEPMLLGRFAGICYNREGNDEKRLKHIIEVGHLSVLRFGMAVFKVEGISRVCLAQLTRSKHLDYLVRSSRYCDESDCEFVWPDSVQQLRDDQIKLIEFLAQTQYKALLKAGIPKQDARFFLPQAQETELYVAGNYQAWSDFIRLRTSKSAQKEVRDVAFEIQRQLREIAPVIFDAD